MMLRHGLNSAGSGGHQAEAWGAVRAADGAGGVCLGSLLCQLSGRSHRRHAWGFPQHQGKP